MNININSTYCEFGKAYDVRQNALKHTTKQALNKKSAIEGAVLRVWGRKFFIFCKNNVLLGLF